MSTKEQAHTATPGPWIAAAGPSSIVGWPIVAQTGRLICNLATPPKDINRIGLAKRDYDEFMAECGANACLISAAPDLLAALQRLTDYGRKPTQADWQAADDAIAKATGAEV
jgi:hypothetical protein